MYHNAITFFYSIVFILIDANGDTYINSTDEVLTETSFDGAGRVRRTRTENPNSTGGYTAKLIEYDILGRGTRESVPTETNSSWSPAGDDYHGMDSSNYIWLWNSSEYDWKGRATRSIPSDSTGSDGKDTLISYVGCGCAGGQIRTVQGPVTTAVDVAGSTQTTKRRTQKIYEDILGRTFKTETWDLDGGGSNPYGTVKTKFNGRDQALSVTEYAGSDSSGTNQVTSMTYDGHGRMASLHKPEWRESNNDPAYSTYTYNADDTVATMTDPRGAVTTNTYGNPGLGEKRPVVIGVAYTSPGSSIPDRADVAFTYDYAGNRLSMSDGTGTLNYTYDELARIVTEIKDFDDYLENAPR